MCLYALVSCFMKVFLVHQSIETFFFSLFVSFHISGVEIKCQMESKASCCIVLVAGIAAARRLHRRQTFGRG